MITWWWLWFPLTQWGRDKIAAISQTTFLNAFFNENMWIALKISPTNLAQHVSNGPINNIPPLVPITDWRLPGDKPLLGPMLVSLPTHICVTWPQLVNKADQAGLWSSWMVHYIVRLNINVLMQKRRNCIAKALELHFLCIKPLIWAFKTICTAANYDKGPFH